MTDQVQGVELLPSGARRCTAHNRAGEQCGAPAVSGATVCQAHGGMASQVQRKARLRLLELVEPAVATLARVLTDQGATRMERLRAAEAILDRAGHPKGVQVTTSGEDAKALLVERLIQLRDQGPADRVRNLSEAVEELEARRLVAGEVVEDGGEDGEDGS